MIAERKGERRQGDKETRLSAHYKWVSRSAIDYQSGRGRDREREGGRERGREGGRGCWGDEDEESSSSTSYDKAGEREKSLRAPKPRKLVR
ncbi:hypothetical protein EYF80_044386 [Liparis tanakae]|uniref:Uncharacterized protein n=1 Tax=Liparis tanakae TaxID=230148 RepID=A0A4Z2FW08_9TELE|nr:hypothetical protein EYF80_044386 [Liparis tanakae]